MSLPRQGASEAGRWQRAQRIGRRWGLWGVLLGAIAGLTFNAPAQWLADALRLASGERLLLAQARGSLWDGSAVLVLTGGTGSHDASALPGRLAWQLRPDGLGLAFTARQDCCIQDGLQLLWQPGWRGYTLRLKPLSPAGSADTPSLIGRWPAAWLSGLGTPWNTLQLGGQLQLASTGLSLQSAQGQLRLEGTIALELQAVSSRLSSLASLGSYRLSLQGRSPDGGATSLQLETLEGALRLSGSGQWTGNGLRFRGQAQAAEGLDAALSNLLNIIGRRQGALSVISIG